MTEDREIFIQADSSQAEARVVWLLADDEDALHKVDTIDYHAYTAVWFFGSKAELFDYDKKKLGYEHPIRFIGKTLRHAGHLGAGKRRASIEVNTQARKYKILIHISEAVAERALKIFHQKQPKIRSVFHEAIRKAITSKRILIAGAPYGLGLESGGRRIFFERYGEDLFRQAYSDIPQRSVTDNTKAAGLRILDRIPSAEIAIVLEAHDSLLFKTRESNLSKHIPIIKQEFERPISFNKCTIKRRDLIIPCEIETGYNYKDLKKFKDIPIIGSPIKEIELKPKTLQEKFLISAVEIPKDSYNTKRLYEAMEQKRFIVGE